MSGRSDLSMSSMIWDEQRPRRRVTDSTDTSNDDSGWRTEEAVCVHHDNVQQRSVLDDWVFDLTLSHSLFAPVALAPSR